jgi:hypothetical protein
MDPEYWPWTEAASRRDVSEKKAFMVDWLRFERVVCRREDGDCGDVSD